MARSTTLACVAASVLGVLGVLGACGGAPHPPPAAAGVKLWETDGHLSEGDVVIEREPEVAFAELDDYAKWPTIFTDVARVEDQGPADGEEKVLLVTTAGQNNNLRFKNDAAHHVVHFRDTGGSAEVWADIAFEPGPRPGTTRVHARLFADVHGFVSIFVTDARLRDQRQKKLASDLSNILRYFSARAASAK